MLTKERATIISNYLAADIEKAGALLDMEPQDALNQVNADGFDFTIEEFNDYAKALKLAKANGELSAEDLEGVAGGFGILAATLCVAGGIALGVACNVKW